MRILFISTVYAPSLGGVEIATHSLAQFLVAHGHEVRVVTNLNAPNLPSAQTIDGIPVKRYRFLTPGFLLRRRRRIDLALAALFVFPALLIQLDHLFRTWRPDVVHFHFPDKQIPYVLLLQRRYHFRLIVSLNGYDILRWETISYQSSASDRLRASLTALLKRADAVTACSNYLLDVARNFEPSVTEKGHVVFHGVDPLRFTNREGYVHTRPYILTVGRLHVDKGIDLLIAAFSQVSAAYPGIDLLLAGAGNELPMLQEQVQRLALQERVHFLGGVEPPQVTKLFNGALFVVVPSRRETFGLVVLEAMAAGKAVLATNVGGLPEFAGEPPNQLVEPAVEALAQALHEWLANVERLRSQGEANRQRAAVHNWTDVVKQYVEIYQEQGAVAR